MVSRNLAQTQVHLYCRWSSPQSSTTVAVGAPRRDSLDTESPRTAEVLRRSFAGTFANRLACTHAVGEWMQMHKETWGWAGWRGYEWRAHTFWYLWAARVTPSIVIGRHAAKKSSRASRASVPLLSTTYEARVYTQHGMKRIWYTIGGAH